MSTKSKDQCYYVYIAQCADRSLYTGFSNDPVRRCAKHNESKGAKYTRARLPVRLVWVSVALPDTGTAMSVEHGIKQLSRARKLELVRKRHAAITLLRDYSGPVDYSGNLMEDDPPLTTKKASAGCKHHENTSSADSGAPASILRMDRAELRDAQEPVHNAGHVRQPDASLTQLLHAMEEVASMESPSVAELLRKRGFKYEAGKVDALVKAWRSYEEARAK